MIFDSSFWPKIREEAEFSRRKKIIEMEERVKRGEPLSEIEKGILGKWVQTYGKK